MVNENEIENEILEGRWGSPIRTVVIGVVCKGNRQHRYDQEITVNTDYDVLREIAQRIPCCGVCGSRDVAFTIAVKEIW